ncbi:MAG: TAXI family TRAP transporter solute-binding subunit [Pseudomonadota bacterium]
MARLTTLIAAAALLVGATSARSQTDVVIGSSSVGGSYYLYAGGLASFLNREKGALRATARTTRGSVENARLLATDQMEFALINAQVLYEQRTGSGQFQNQQNADLRGLALVDLAPSHWVAMASSNIRGFDDLKGKRVSIGAPGSGGANSALIVLEAFGIKDQIRIVNLGFEESANNLRDGNLEAFTGGSALPMPAVLALATTRSIRLLSFDPAFIQRLQARYPTTEQTVIPKGTYAGVDYDVTTIGTPSTVATSVKVPDQVVYEMTKQIDRPDARQYVKTIYSTWDPQPGTALFERIGVPLHPGALRYYREAGVVR